VIYRVPYPTAVDVAQTIPVDVPDHVDTTIGLREACAAIASLMAFAVPLDVAAAVKLTPSVKVTPLIVKTPALTPPENVAAPVEMQVTFDAKV
jgi:hypothetical protein